MQMRTRFEEARMKVRKAALLAFGLFVALSAAYVAGRIVFEIGLGIIWAASISAVIFAIAILVIVRRPTVGPQ
jgi:hypothetical protein